ncbi:hypothetical protein SAMN05421874_106261 [Nonomuraea maritima]|uniref:DUF8094 domain-containing protein n=1 Tax=Nonomuraea maritima TaxID=683260 RepID=A0A1G9ANI1_9ACTN|nr:hypothetical protein SAMN05421874_106261 [Nonomuraea maritima]
MLALAVGVLATVSACSVGARSTPVTPSASAPKPSPSLAPPAVTRAEAAEQFAAITATDDALRAPSDLQGRLDLEVKDLMTGGQAELTKAAFLSHDFAPPRYRWGPPTLFVPRFPEGERSPWFSALATRNGQPTLLTFTKSNEWRLSSAAQLLPGERLPDIQLDADGYATAVATDDKTVTISPQFMGPVHASVAETGTAGVTAGLLAPGPYTTDVAEQIATYRETAKSDGFSYDSLFSADNFPVYGLRTADGGALIQYSLTRITSTKNMTNESYIIPVPEEASWAITSPSVPRSLRLTEVHQYATVVPPLSDPAPAQVIAHDGALTRAAGD